MEIYKTKITSIFQPKISPLIKHKPLIIINYKTQFIKPPNSHLQHKKISNLLPISHYNQNPPLKPTNKNTHFPENDHSTLQITLLVSKLKKGNLSPLQLLKDDTDWCDAQFWAVIYFLVQSSKCYDILEVFNAWTKLQESRINPLNYKKIIRLLSGAGMTNEATLALQNMKNYGLELCSEVYSSIIHGYALEGKFDEALRYLGEMEETNVNPVTETYDGLIKGYGKFQMYDEMVKCLKKMESSGCLPDHVTYNLLICELSKGGLINRMERMYHTLVSKKLGLRPSTMVAMLEAYVNFGVLDKMEMFYMKVKRSNTVLKERMVQKIARVYIEHHMFSRLDDLATDVGVGMGRNNLYWCLRLLSQGCQLSRKGMNGVIQLMEEERVLWNETVVNIISFSYLKMKNFKQLDMVFTELPHRCVQPDFITLGILYDGHELGFEWSRTLKIWRKYGYLRNGVEVNTDPLVLSAFGKGVFLRTVEELSSSLAPKIREEKLWTYEMLFDFVIKHHRSTSLPLPVNE